jgi:hypothetical protein
VFFHTEFFEMKEGRKEGEKEEKSLLDILGV